MKDNEKKTGFVYCRQALSENELGNLLEKLATLPSYYFVRSPHAVSGICMSLPDDFPGFEGQLFNAKLEFRWKKQGAGYETLLLSQEEANLEGFKPLEADWEICDRDAHFYLTSQNQQPANFPKKFIFLDEHEKEIEKPENIQIRQRYFKDSKTATVHFVALTINNKNDRNSSTQT